MLCIAASFSLSTPVSQSSIETLMPVNDLRDNKSDVAIGVFTYPPFNYWSQFKTQHKIDTVYPYEVPFEYHTVIVSVYNVTKEKYKIDFLKYSVGVFDWQVWV